MTDRRQRLLYLTQRGRQLAADLLGVQARQFAAALAAVDSGLRPHLAAFLLQMVEPDERSRVARLLEGRRTEQEP